MSLFRLTFVSALVTVAACQPVSCGGGSAPVLLRDPAAFQRCRERQNVSVTPLFTEGPSETGPAITTRADGVRVTTIAGRVRGRHEREARFSTYDVRSFENRSYRLIIEDAVPVGRSEVKVTLFLEADVSTFGPGINFRHWKIYGPLGNQNGGYTFAVNIGMTKRSPRELEQTVTENVREGGRPLQTGDVLDFELGLYLAGADPADPDPIPGGSAYFSDTFRYRVGIGGLSAETFDDAGLLGPVAAAQLGGELSVPIVALPDGTLVEPRYALSQLGLWVQPPHAQEFLEGRRLFHTAFDTGEHLENGNPPLPLMALGPLFNAKSCVSCHAFNGRGVLPDALVWQLPESEGLGAQLQLQEAALTYLGDEEVVVEGEVLHRPRFDAGRPLSFSPRLAPALVGLGLLEALDEAELISRADEADCDGDGISGRVALAGGQLGRFGWKGQHASLAAQVRTELSEQHGVTPQELGEPEVQRLVTYLRTLGVVPQRRFGETARGAALFSELGCAACHVESLRTGDTHPFVELRGQRIRPFTDLLLHDLGPGLADSSGTAEASEWRTAPLWGLGLVRQVSGAMQLLHDGRAASVPEAIWWHGGEAQRSRDAFRDLGAADRQALVDFLESL